jgi:hypothetical protein
MKKNFLFLARFFLRIFFIAVVVNTAVASAQLLHNTDFSFADLLQVVFLTFRIGLFLFALVCILLFLIALFATQKHEKIFWWLMLAGLSAIGAVYLLFDNLFMQYKDQAGIFASIAAFAMMVSLASQYQLFYHYTVSNHDQ